MFHLVIFVEGYASRVYRYKVKGHADVDGGPVVYTAEVCFAEDETRRGMYYITSYRRSSLYAVHYKAIYI